MSQSCQKQVTDVDYRVIIPKNVQKYYPITEKEIVKAILKKSGQMLARNV